MSPGDRYVIPASADDEWVRPQPIDELVVDAVLEQTEYDEDALDPLSSYVDLEELAGLFDDDTDATDLSFTLEGLEVTVHHTGEVVVESES